MALKQWWDVPYTAADCMKGHVTFNNMIDYIKHSACTDFKIYSTCTSGGQAFRFTQAGTLSQMYGGTTGDLQIIANETNTYPFIKLLGDSDAEIQVKLDKFFWFYVNAIKTVRFGRDSNDCQIKGGDNTIRALSLWANTIDAFPYIKLTGGGKIELRYANADDIAFYEQANERFKFEEHQIDFNADRAIYINDDETCIGHGAGDGAAGTNNTFIGHDAGSAGVTNSNNTAIGYEACKSLLGGAKNVGLGADALASITTGNENMGIGFYTLYTLTTGTGNVAIGHRAGRSAANNLDKCIYLGYEAGLNNAASNRLYINNSSNAFSLIYGEFDNDAVKFGDGAGGWNIQFMQSRIHMLETTTPGAIVDYGAIYCKADNKLYFQDGAGAEHEVAFV